ncbi:hypothetical protein [Cellulosimicrobium arenosum]|uniref:Uncharacterized protein n=1 Tax=Cellulosimicrobium arenosum TaxID=2708133 RepID=A0A927G8F8_9MICO|nr:hypothetical protein [Cellulosimicrobium arenosum]MBD8078633.1 hypothetical protein [Cellulosimicrobium arenosum]
MILVARVPHDRLVDALREVGCEMGRIGPTDERGWTAADVELPLDLTVDARFALVDRHVAGGWLALVEHGSDDLPLDVAAVLAAGTGGRTATARYVPDDAEPVTHGMLDEDASIHLADDPDDLLRVVDSLGCLREPVVRAADGLRAVHDLAVLLRTLPRLIEVPRLDAPPSRSTTYLVRGDVDVVRAAARTGGAAWVRSVDERYTVLVTAVSGVVPDDDDRSGFVDAVRADSQVLGRITSALHADEAVLRLDRSAPDAWSWTLDTGVDARAHRSSQWGNWHPRWTYLDDAEGRSGAPRAFAAVFGPPRDPRRFQELLDAGAWPGDPVAELLQHLQVPATTGAVVAEAVGDPDRFRHGARRLDPVSKSSPLTAHERTALLSRASLAGAGHWARELVVGAVALVALVLGVGLALTDGAMLGLDETPGFSGVLIFGGIALGVVALLLVTTRRGEQKRFLGERE